LDKIRLASKPTGLIFERAGDGRVGRAKVELQHGVRRGRSSTHDYSINLESRAALPRFRNGQATGKTAGIPALAGSYNCNAEVRSGRDNAREGRAMRVVRSSPIALRTQPFSGTEVGTITDGRRRRGNSSRRHVEPCLPSSPEPSSTTSRRWTTRRLPSGPTPSNDDTAARKFRYSPIRIRVANRARSSYRCKGNHQARCRGRGTCHRSPSAVGR